MNNTDGRGRREEDLDIEDLDVEDMDLEDLNVEDLNVEDLEIKDLDIEDLDLEDLKREDLNRSGRGGRFNTTWLLAGILAVLLAAAAVIYMNQTSRTGGYSIWELDPVS